MREILQRYYITVCLLQRKDLLFLALLWKRKSINSTTSFCITWYQCPRIFDKAVFSTFIASLKQNSYFIEDNQADINQLNKITDILNKMISAEVCLTIKSAVEKGEE